MRIAQISLFTPTATNIKGASALPYHLMKVRDEDVELDVWTFNLNECSAEQIAKSEEELDIKIHVVPVSRKQKWLSPAIVRLFLPYPFQYYLNIPKQIIADVKLYLGNDTNNGVWIYGEDLARHITKFLEYKCVVTTPDCEAMYYYRMFAEKGVPTSWKSLIRYGLMYHRYAKMESEFPKGMNVKYHLVGKEDTQFLKNINNGIDARFIRHPHYDIVNSQLLKEKVDSDIDRSRKLRLLIAGRYDIYMRDAVDETISVMRTVADRIRDKYHITFLGKSWEVCVQQLSNAGFSVEKKEYVEDYVAEVSSHDIQLTPIFVGTGTKGKVLDAFANGLMVMGTLRALENIAVESGISCVQYNTSEELESWLLALADGDGKQRVKAIAKVGHEAVLKEHGREMVAKEFFRLFKACD